MTEGKLYLATTPLQRLRGLLGRKRGALGTRGVLVLVPCSSVHTYGMDERLDIAFADAEGKVLAAYRDVRPGKVLSCKGACMAMERFAEPGVEWYVAGEGMGLAFLHVSRVPDLCR